MTMYQPTFEGAVRERTEIRVGHDDEFLYVSGGGGFYGSNPKGIRANSLYRDRYPERSPQVHLHVPMVGPAYFLTNTLDARGEAPLSSLNPNLERDPHRGAV